MKSTASDPVKTASRLCEASRRKDPSLELGRGWPERLEGGAWFMSPELISIYATPAYAELDDTARMRLSFFEAVNFFSLNIHGEKSLLEGIARRLYRQDLGDLSAYLHHFLDEENRHMACFGEFCSRYAGKIYPNRKLSFTREYAEGEDDFLFFAKVLIFEDIVDFYNRRMARDARLHPVAREINRMHHRDEIRHLAFGRSIVANTFFHYRERWAPSTLSEIQAAVGVYLASAWKEYYNPGVYRDAGLPLAYELYQEAFNCPPARAHRRRAAANSIRFLMRCGILETEPQL